ncbi:MAG: hypothetical protein R2780_14835 [Crocinitomicaceae bacterium]|nr:hypothetical protein [Crocinitomicaceae bacterium]
MIRSFVLSIGIIITTTTTFGQDSPDISILITNQRWDMLGIEFRQPIKEKWKLNYCLSYGSYFHSFDLDFVSANDTVIVQRGTQRTNRLGTFKFGTERQLKESVFSIGLDLITSYRNQDLQNSDRTYTLNDGIWRRDQTSTNMNTAVKHQIIPGLAVNANIDLIIWKNLLLNISMIGTIRQTILLNGSEFNDPANEFFEKNTFKPIFGQYFQAGVRYRINTKKDANPN